MMAEETQKLIAVALVFALCGAWSSSFMDADTGTDVLAVPIPFAFLMLGLLRGRVWARLLTLPLVTAVWFLAYLGVMSGAWDRPFLAMSVGGMIGGVGVTLWAAIGQRRLLSPKYLILAATVGGVSALPFGFWLRVFAGRHSWDVVHDSAQAMRLHISFAVWQAAVGVFLYAASRRLGKGNDQYEATQ